MKFLLMAAVTLLTLSAHAKGPQTSVALVGKYKLVKASSESAKRHYCADEIEVRLTHEALILDGTNGYSHASFWASAEGCQIDDGDIGPVRTRCTRFNRYSVSYSDTQPVSIAGFVRETESVSLSSFNKNRLTYSHDVTAIPFGALGIWDQDEFSCEYVRQSR